jgi:hypothetical protein
MGAFRVRLIIFEYMYFGIRILACLFFFGKKQGRNHLVYFFNIQSHSLHYSWPVFSG